MTSASSILVPLRGPCRGEVLTHVERSRHRVARDGAREPEAQRVSMALGHGAGDLHRRALDRAAEIARDEIALVGPFEAIAGLLQMQRMRGRAREVVDAHVPL